MPHRPETRSAARHPEPQTQAPRRLAPRWPRGTHPTQAARQPRRRKEKKQLYTSCFRGCSL